MGEPVRRPANRRVVDAETHAAFQIARRAIVVFPGEIVLDDVSLAVLKEIDATFHLILSHLSSPPPLSLTTQNRCQWHVAKVINDVYGRGPTRTAISRDNQFQFFKSRPKNSIILFTLERAVLSAACSVTNRAKLPLR